MRAEGTLRGQPADLDEPSSGDVQRLFQELRGHQTELERQNEELRRTQQELEASCDRYADLYDLAPVGYVTVSEKGLILEANLTGAALLGVERGRLIGRPLSRYVASEDQDVYYLHCRRALETRARQACELRMVRAGDASFDAQLQSIVLRGSDGNDTCRTVITDASERERTAERLRFQAQLLENVRESVVATDLDGHVIYWGKGAEALYGYRADEVMGKLITFVVKPQEKQEEVERMRQVQEKGSWSGQYVQRRRDGSSFWADTVISLGVGADGQPYGLIGIDRDITDRVRAEEALRIERDSAQQYLDIAGVIIVALNAEGEVTLINRKGCQVLEREETGILGRNWFDHFVPESIRTLVKMVFQKLMAGEIESVEYFENPVLTRRGQERTIAWYNTLLTDRAGNTVGTLSSGEDITERVRAEEEIARLARFPRENPNPVLRVRKDGTILYGNQASAVLFTARGRQVGQRLPDLWQREASSALDSGSSGTIETHAGDRVFVLTFAPMVDAGYVNVYGLDITERVRVEQALQQRTKQLEALRASSLELAAELDLDDLLHSIVSRAAALLGTMGGTLDIYRPEQDVLEFIVQVGLDAIPSQTTFRRGEGLVGRVWQNEAPVIVDDYQRWEGRAATWSDYLGSSALVGVPVRWGTTFLGVLTVIAAPSRTFSASDADLLRLFAAQAAIAIRNIRLYERAQHEIVERVRAQKEITELARFPDENPHPMLRIAGDGTIRYANQASTPLLDLWGCQRNGLVPGNQRRLVLDVLHSGSSQDEEVEVEDRVLSLTFAPIADAGYVNVYGLDITERVRAKESLAREARINAVVAELSQALIQSVSLEHISSLVLGHAKELTGSAFGFVGYIDPQTGYLVTPTLSVDVWDICQIPDKDLVFKEFGGLWGWVLVHGQPLLTNDPVDDPRSSGVPSGHIPIQRFLSVPALIGGTLVGQVALANPGRDYSGRDLALAERLASLYALAVQRRRAEDEITSLARFSSENPNPVLRVLQDGTVLYGNRASAVLLTAWGRQAGQRLPDVWQAVVSNTLDAGSPSAAETNVGDRVFLLTFTPVVEQGYVNVYGLDITARVRAEEELRSYREHLEDLVQERTAELAETNARLQREIGERERAEAELVRLNQELRTLNEIAITLSQSPDLHDVLNATLDKVLATTGLDAGWIHLLDKDENLLLLAAHRGLSQETAQAAETVPSHSLVHQAFRSGQPVVADQVSDAVCLGIASAATETLHAFAGVPIRSQDRVLGVLCVHSRRPRKPTSREIQLLTAVGHQVGVAVENARLVEEAAELEILQEFDRLRSELIANVSHELRTPLGLIKAFCSSLMMEDVTLDQETRADFLDGIDEEADKLETIVTNLLSLSRVESGRLYLDVRPTDVGHLIRRVSAAMAMDIHLTEHRFVHDLPSEPLVANVDARSVEQVLRNLLSNALKYAPGGGTITVHGHRDETQVLIAVSDEGIGISSADLKRVFERFYRVDSKVTRNIGGVGLGLAVCKSIVEAHGGRIWVESVLGEGSTFTFTLPAEAQGRATNDRSALRGEAI
jgi:PAS domain S-box-containing protein